MAQNLRSNSWRFKFIPKSQKKKDLGAFCSQWVLSLGARGKAEAPAAPELPGGAAGLFLPAAPGASGAPGVGFWEGKGKEQKGVRARVCVCIYILE